jgi:uncharacterized FlaG/YvyC family protein
MYIDAVSTQGQPIVNVLDTKPQEQAEITPVAKVKAVVKAETKPVPDLHHAEIDRNPGFSADEIKVKIAELNQALVEKNQSVGFSTDSRSGHQVVTVSNLTTGELIRQMPSVDVLRAMNNIDRMMGLIFSERT